MLSATVISPPPTARKFTNCIDGGYFPYLPSLLSKKLDGSLRRLSTEETTLSPHFTFDSHFNSVSPEDGFHFNTERNAPRSLLSRLFAICGGASCNEDSIAPCADHYCEFLHRRRARNSGNDKLPVSERLVECADRLPYVEDVFGGEAINFSSGSHTTR